ncbi:hypothetical protein K431DRAFT_307796 [Polychaeton citri CBS 116435]|uniref:Lysine-specific metallo-endopeptidase domain-containing protein n=1 Tax=Polychaeton citri CBS 116435 TaxID=1314669 RepID=A0A9P4PWW6_9PEZI|nr:hypothetical protein K431DRAFT_307796 [Polychaeton citri CBS 116435]
MYTASWKTLLSAGLALNAAASPIFKFHNTGLHKRAPAIATAFELASGVASDCGANAATLQTWFDESLTMADTALNAMDRAEQDGEIRRVLSNLFGIQFGANGQPTNPENFLVVQEFLTAIRDFINSGSSPNLSQKTQLFCGSQWMTPVAWDSDLIGGDGQPVIDHSVNPAEPYHVDEEITFASAKADGLTPYRVLTSANPANLPQVSAYIFDNSYTAGQYGGTYCDGTNSLGATYDGLRHLHQDFPDIITLCPLAFTKPQYNNVLGDAPRANRNVAASLPKSSTLFHEMIHLVKGVSETDDFNFYSVSKCTNDARHNNGDTARGAPECYVYFATAMYYRMTGDNTGQHWSWASGRGLPVGPPPP